MTKLLLNHSLVGKEGMLPLCCSNKALKGEEGEEGEFKDRTTCLNQTKGYSIPFDITQNVILLWGVGGEQLLLRDWQALINGWRYIALVACSWSLPHSIVGSVSEQLCDAQLCARLNHKRNSSFCFIFQHIEHILSVLSLNYTFSCFPCICQIFFLSTM